MKNYAYLIFLILAFISFYFNNYDFAIGNLIASVGFALSHFRMKLIVIFKIYHINERTLRIIGETIGFTGILIPFVLRLIKLIIK